MSDQNPTVIDSKGRWPAPELETRTEPVRVPGIVSVDAQGRILSWNHAAAVLLADAGSALALGQPFVRLEVEAGRLCSVAFSRSFTSSSSCRTTT